MPNLIITTKGKRYITSLVKKEMLDEESDGNSMSDTEDWDLEVLDSLDHMKEADRTVEDFLYYKDQDMISGLSRLVEAGFIDYA